MDHESITIEIARIVREATARAEKKIRDQQKGELFADLPTTQRSESSCLLET